jgi:hypothetical protein
VNEREHGRMWEARGIAIEIMLSNIYPTPLKWSEVGPLYRALIVGGGQSTVGGERGT